MMRCLLFFIATCFFACKSSKPKSPAVPEERRGVLITIGNHGDIFFIDSVAPADGIATILNVVDTFKVAKRLFYFYRNLKDSVVGKMTTFPDDSHLCGNSSSESKIKYLFVTIDILNDEYSMSPSWKKRYGEISTICIYSPSRSINSLLKFRNANMMVRRILPY